MIVLEHEPNIVTRMRPLVDRRFVVMTSNSTMFLIIGKDSGSTAIEGSENWLMEIKTQNGKAVFLSFITNFI
jgi:hypothetical protein